MVVVSSWEAALDMAKTLQPEDLAKSGSEHGEQCAVMLWAALNRSEYPQLRWLHAIPNGNSHHQVAEGVRSGVPDLHLPFPVRQWHGFYCEMKIESRRNHKNGGRTDEQVEWHEYLTSAGYFVVTCYSWQEAIQAILEYLTGASHGTSK